MKARVKANGRDPEKAKILPGVYVIIGSTEEEATAIRRRWSRFSEMSELQFANTFPGSRYADRIA
jgi:alkanesulfonate monooxygenase SsuD/methylene tetrahydromethanopterin reductase-like flavin-dependent oxidoreductase (luciferase family)